MKVKTATFSRNDVVRVISIAQVLANAAHQIDPSNFNVAEERTRNLKSLYRDLGVAVRSLTFVK